eukprot:TRINITY_DN13471_c0_g1_i10.p1 TRINITY_DN13471_c0_g1~~TRINITY_DN13471_c0_g1_i10.p1  ORF type:complete len:532 (-),score=141.76 TRINITY_DN13471_c0_g1_i10:225-1820(-)
MAREVIGVKMAIAVLRALGLEEVQDSLVGTDDVRGISGGQKKRMEIGRVLVSNPYLIFLDEPTSGLSAADAVKLMKEVKKLVTDLGIVAVSVIHQPRNRLFKMFDNLILLCNGKMVYSGPPKSAAAKYFASIEHPKHALPNQCNPADHYVDHITPSIWGQAEMQGMFDFFENPSSKVCELSQQYMDSVGISSADAKTEAMNPFHGWIRTGKGVWGPGEGVYVEGSLPSVLHRLDEARSIQNSRPELGKDVQTLASELPLPLSLSERMKVLFFKELVCLKRDQIRFTGKIFNAIFMGLLLGPVYANIEAQNLAAFAMIVTYIPLTQSFAVMPTLFRERQYAQLERASGLYDTKTYFLITFVYSFFFSCLTAFSMLVICYAFTDLPWWPQFPIMYLVVVAGFGMMDGVIYVVAYSCKTMDQMLVVFNGTIGIFMFANGFTMNKDTSPGWINWLLYISPIFYSMEATLSAFVHYGSYSGADEVEHLMTCTGSQGCLGLSGDNVVWRNILIMAALAVVISSWAGYCLATKHLPER